MISALGNSVAHDMHDTLFELVGRLCDPAIAQTKVIPWSCPVPSFGDLSTSWLATLGLNPSNREFVDGNGNELNGDCRRLHTLSSLDLACWSEADSEHVELIVQSCRDYFTVNPYDGWFMELENLIAGTKASYYESSNSACHLDLIPYATGCKWTELTTHERSSLLSFAGDTLGLLLRESPIRVLVLNGRSVVENLQRMSGVELDRRRMPAWTLPRRSGDGVAGFAYSGVVKQLAGVKLRRPTLVLGYNHNIQSSFGVTTKVKVRIRQWIRRMAKGIMP